MHDDFIAYSTKILANTQQAVINLVMFIPYFFSVQTLPKYLFAPWKNITTIARSDGKKPDFWTRMGDQFASRLIGFMVRSSILVAYLFVQVGFVIMLPFIYAGILLALPLMYVFYTVSPSPKEKREHEFNQFMKRHLLDEDNKGAVIEWFEIYYAEKVHKPWWTMEKLKSQPPLGRDLNHGFTYTLDQFSTELTLKQPHHTHLIGRQGELDVIQRILSKTGEANVLLTGDPGVGKHAIVESLAKSIYEGSSNPLLAYKRILEVDITKILSTATDNIKRSEVLKRMFEEAANAKNIIIYIPDLQRYISQEYVDITQILARYASRPDIQFIATITPYNYQKYVVKNKIVAGLFDKVDIKEVTPNQAIRIMLDVVPKLERKYGVFVVYEAVVRAVMLGHRYVTQTPLPESAIELIQEACIFAKNHNETNAVNAHVVNTVVEQMTHIPIEISDSLKQRLLTLEQTLEKRVLYQERALSALAQSLRKAFISLENRTKPLASFLFLGPTGVGKTETAKAVTEVFFESDQKMIRFDMSNYQSPSDISRLLGSNTSAEPGLLTQAVRKAQYGTLLLDELEKAHPDILNIFLTILDEGYFTDGYGERVDCSHLIIIATSNAGAEFIFKSLEKGVTELEDGLIEYLIDAEIYSPEFLNRFDGVIVYKPLYKEAMIAIAQRMLARVKTEALEKHNIDITFSKEFVRDLVEKGYDPKFGARNMQRLITETVEDQISKAVLSGTASGKTLTF